VGVFWRPAPTDAGRWALLLPGASGLRIFDDDGHYFRAAAALHAEGFDVLVVDYKAFYRASPDRPDVETGDKIAWVVERCIAWARDSGRIAPDQPGVLVAWSLGAEGLWPMLPDAPRLERLGVRAAAAYYPSHESRTPITSAVPLLVLTGEADDVTPLKDLRRVLDPARSPGVELVTYPEAHHGFDIESLTKPRTVRLLPLVGPSGTFAHGEAAAADARARLAAFIGTHAPGPR
jgi:dienelactone hydrolase